jgi:hypothetical protein
MSLSLKNLSSIQRIGQAVHDSSEAIAAIVRTQAESMVASMSTAPFSAESELLIARFKTLSKLSQGLAAVETQLQELYGVAADLANPASDVIVLPSIAKRKVVSNSAVVDVTAKTSMPPKTTKMGRKGKGKGVALTANDNKLLVYLQSALKSGEATAITGNVMSADSGLPLGSLGLSLKKVIASGAVRQVGRGTYQLDATAGALSVEPADKSTPVKTKPAVAKRVKAQLGAAKELKAVAAKKAKSVTSRKAKSVAGVVGLSEVAASPAVEADASSQ